MRESDAVTTFGLFAKKEHATSNPMFSQLQQENIKLDGQASFDASELLLVEKNSIDGRLVNIYLDNNGRIKARITEKDGITTPAFFVKGIDTEIDISNKILIQWLKDTLEQNCVLKVFAGDVHVNLQLKGGLPPELAFSWTLAQLSLGALFAMCATPAAPIVAPLLSAGLLGSGCNTFRYLWSNINEPDNITLANYSREAFTGGVRGMAGGSVGYFAAPAGIVQQVATNIASGLTKTVTERMAYNVVKPTYFAFSQFTHEEAESLKILVGRYFKKIRTLKIEDGSYKHIQLTQKEISKIKQKLNEIKTWRAKNISKKLKNNHSTDFNCFEIAKDTILDAAGTTALNMGLNFAGDLAKQTLNDSTPPDIREVTKNVMSKGIKLAKVADSLQSNITRETNMLNRVPAAMFSNSTANNGKRDSSHQKNHESKKRPAKLARYL